MEGSSSEEYIFIFAMESPTIVWKNSQKSTKSDRYWCCKHTKIEKEKCG
jgi:hypothetical protein